MKPFTINKNSWHFKVANKFGGGVRTHSYYNHDIQNQNMDFCAYFWKVIGVCAAVGFLSVLTILLTACVADFLAWIVAGLLHGFVVPDVGAGLVLVSIIMGALGGAMIGYQKIKSARYNKKQNAKYAAEKKGEVYVEPPPSFWKLAYRKFKNKTCVQLQFEG